VQQLIFSEYHATQVKIKLLLKFAFTVDVWTSNAQMGYIACTVHFDEPLSWELHHFTLGLDKKDGEVVEYAEYQMTAFDIGYASLTSIVSDTEATKVAAA
jgi:hypothetical protein